MLAPTAYQTAAADACPADAYPPPRAALYIPPPLPSPPSNYQPPSPEAEAARQKHMMDDVNSFVKQYGRLQMDTGAADELRRDFAAPGLAAAAPSAGPAAPVDCPPGVPMSQNGPGISQEIRDAARSVAGSAEAQATSTQASQRAQVAATASSQHTLG